jgi:alpha-ketoglutarate-dependent taurine dioxygenase
MSTTQPVPAFRIGQRKQLRVSGESLVNISTLSADQPLPAVIQAAVDGVGLSSWLSSHLDQVQELILHHGAVLFRGFSIQRPEDFQSAVTALCGEAMSYKERSSPRSQVADKVYTSTDYPADEEIFPHNEHSYSKTFPVKLFFCCDTPALTGGSTPLADTRRAYQRIPAEIRAEFERKGWMFVRNFNTGCGLPWQTVFQTKDRSVVEDYCRSANIEWEWRSGDQLRTRQVRPAIVQHPATGERVWFNHLTFFHVSTLKPSLVKMLRASFAEDEMPNNTFFGEGSPIPDDAAEQLRRAYLDEKVSFSWQKGDLIVLDNILTAHARDSYTGPRKILFAMAEPFERDLARELAELGR